MEAALQNPLAGAVGVKGLFRIQITEDQPNGEVKVVGDSKNDPRADKDGYIKNQVVNDGIRDYLVDALLGNSPLGAVSHAALGTGGEPASNATTLTGELDHSAGSRQAVTTSVVSSRTAQFVGTFDSSNSFVTATANLSNIGLFNTSTTQAGALFAGQAFASSAVQTNQNLNFTYQVRFTSA